MPKLIAKVKFYYTVTDDSEGGKSAIFYTNSFLINKTTISNIIYMQTWVLPEGFGA